MLTRVQMDPARHKISNLPDKKQRDAAIKRLARVPLEELLFQLNNNLAQRRAVRGPAGPAPAPAADPSSGGGSNDAADAVAPQQDPSSDARNENEYKEVAPNDGSKIGPAFVIDMFARLAKTNNQQLPTVPMFKTQLETDYKLFALSVQTTATAAAAVPAAAAAPARAGSIAAAATMQQLVKGRVTLPDGFRHSNYRQTQASHNDNNNAAINTNKSTNSSSSSRPKTYSWYVFGVNGVLATQTAAEKEEAELHARSRNLLSVDFVDAEDAVVAAATALTRAPPSGKDEVRG
jgi:hypothetical protein